MNIVLVGFRCSGKTTVGEALGEGLGREFHDTDALVEERAGAPIDTIVQNSGWAGFRDLERRVVREISLKDNLIIATGGGVVTEEGNLQALRRNGWVVWLDGDNLALRARMEAQEEQGRTRPSLTDTDPVGELDAVYGERRPLYERACDFRVDTTDLSVPEVSRIIMTKRPFQNDKREV